MDAGDIIAIDAAVVATAALVWQVFQWRHRRKSHVDVAAKLAIFPMINGDVRDGVSITVTNRSERPIRVTSAGLFAQDGTGSRPPPTTTAAACRSSTGRRSAIPVLRPGLRR